MQIIVLAQHAPHAPRLQKLLGKGFSVTGLAALPADGPITTDVLVTTKLTAQEAQRLQARLLQAPGAGLDAIALDALPAGCRVCNVYEAVTRRAESEAGADATHPVANLASLLPRIDVLVLCCPLNESTRWMVGGVELAAMRPDALLINVGRAELVQQRPLFDALQSRRLGRAVLDAWYRYPAPGQKEPMTPAEFPFTELPNARCTPHISGWTHGLLGRRYAFIARNIARLAAGDSLQNLQR